MKNQFVPKNNTTKSREVNRKVLDTFNLFYEELPQEVVDPALRPQKRLQRRSKTK